MKAASGLMWLHPVNFASISKKILYRIQIPKIFIKSYYMNFGIMCQNNMYFTILRKINMGIEYD